MKLALLLLAFILAVAASAQTKPKLLDVEPPPNLTDRVVMFTNAGLLFVQLDPATLVLDKSTSPATLRAIVTAGPPAKVETEEFFKVVVPSQVFTLATVPAAGTITRVYKNGAKMMPGEDYDLAGAVVTFRTAQPITAKDIISVEYWK